MRLPISWPGEPPADDAEADVLSWEPDDAADPSAGFRLVVQLPGDAEKQIVVGAEAARGPERRWEARMTHGSYLCAGLWRSDEHGGRVLESDCRDQGVLPIVAALIARGVGEGAAAASYLGAAEALPPAGERVPFEPLDASDFDFVGRAAEAQRVRLRPLDPGDVDALYDMEKRIYPRDMMWPKSLFRRLALKGDAWVADDGGRPAGLIITSVRRGVPWIETVEVSPDHRGMGIAGRLMAVGEGAARGEGFGEIRLEVGSDNPAKDLYAAKGYETVKVKHDYYSRGHHALVMSKALD